MKTRLATWDKAGIFLSVLCLIHCLAAPVVLVALPALALGSWHPSIHIALALLIIPVGLLAFVRGHKIHGDVSVLVLGVIGLVVVGVFPLVADYMHWHRLETWVVSVGSLCLVVAHWKNYRARACACGSNDPSHTHF